MRKWLLCLATFSLTSLEVAYISPAFPSIPYGISLFLVTCCAVNLGFCPAVAAIIATVLFTQNPLSTASIMFFVMAVLVAAQCVYLRKRYERAIAIRDQMTAWLSHEIRNPLTAVKATAEITHRKSPEEVTKNSMQIIVASVNKVTDLLSDVLALSKLDAGCLTLTRKLTDLDQIVYRTVEQYRPLAEQSGLVLKIGLLENHKNNCDEKRIAQVLSNLLSNSIKFTPKGGTILVGLNRIDGAVVFSIQDTGRGLSLEHQRRVFERYWQALDDTKSGTGLGLWIARGIVEAHHGKIWATSAGIDLGSTFFFSIPA